jgi:predicted metal-dependent peptidase
MARKIESYTKEIVKQSYDEVKQRGNMPGFVSNVIDQYFSKRKVPYYQIISKLIKGSRFSKIKTAYSKINKKRTYLFQTSNNNNIPEISPFPGKTKDTSFKICIILDTSGSMSVDDVRQGLSGAKDIIENDRDCITTIVEIDTVIHRIYDIKRVSDIKFDIHGRGGTCLFDALSYAKKQKYDVSLVFTDGYCEHFNSIDRKLLPKKIIWVITPNGSPHNVNGVGFTLI